MKKKLLLIPLALLLAISLLAIACTTTPEDTTTPPTAEPIILKVGCIMPISGMISNVGISLTRGMELCFDKVNEQGGLIIGDERYVFELISEDSKLSPEASGTAAKKLVYEDGAKFIFGAIMETSAAAIYDVTSNAPDKVLHLISWINYSWHPADVNPDKPLCIRPMISPHDTVIPNLDYLVEAYPDAKTMVISAPDDIGAETMIELVKSAAEERGLEVTVEKWGLDVVDFAPFFIRVLSYNPDVVYAMVSGQAHYQLRAARELGFTGVFVSDSPLGPDEFIAIAGPEFCTDVICSGWDPGNPTDVMREVMERWEAKYTEPFISDCVMTYDEAWILVQAMEKAQSVDPEVVMATLESMTEMGSLQTSFGLGYIGGLADFGCNRVLVRPVAITIIMFGEIELVKYVLPEVK